MEEYQDLLRYMMQLADRVTMARLGLLHEIQVDGEEVKPATIKYAVGPSEEWEKYPAYFRQTLAYLAASVRDSFAVLDSPAHPVELT